MFIDKSIVELSAQFHVLGSNQTKVDFGDYFSSYSILNLLNDQSRLYHKVF